MSKKQTVAGARYDRDRREQEKITRAYQYRNDTGFCPVCHKRPSAHGITCGELECIKGWLFWRKPRVEENDDEPDTSHSDE